jgi:hypothetical protein
MFYGAGDLQTALKETVDPATLYPRAVAGHLISTLPAPLVRRAGPLARTLGARPAKLVTSGTFMLTKDANLVDLSDIPPVPSIYDEKERRRLRSPLFFPRGFRETSVGELLRNGREHVEYVPTQVVTEYFRHIFATRDGARPDGIVYPSAQHEDGESLVLFIERQDCLAADEPADDRRLQLRLLEAKRLTLDSKLNVIRNEPLELPAHED